METLEADLARARALDVDALADAVESIGFECTRCGACCKGYVDDEGGDPHTATVFPDEVRDLQAATEYDWRDVARPMPYGLTGDDATGETFEWALETDDCGDCTFYEDGERADDPGRCTVHGDRPLVCKTYPFSVGLGGTGQPMGGVVDEEGPVRAHECEGLGRAISREDAEELARALKERAIRELEEAIAVRENYRPTDEDGVVVHDSEGQKRPDGSPLDD
ncbi:MAG: YkgJ family cysteine cluster protein [Haloferacaceae archaeon]